MRRGGSSQDSYNFYQDRQWYIWDMTTRVHHTKRARPSCYPQPALISWKAASPQIVTARFTRKKKNINISIIQCYSRTNDAEDKGEESYVKLQSAVNGWRPRRKSRTCISVGYQTFIQSMGVANCLGLQKGWYNMFLC